MCDEFRVRAITSFISLTPEDFTSGSTLSSKISIHATFLKFAEKELQSKGYEVQTLRIATNPFGEYLAPFCEKDNLQKQLKELDEVLAKYSIEFFALGPARNEIELDCCPVIVRQSHRLSCSAELRAGNDVLMAKKAAKCMRIISEMGESEDAPPHLVNGLGNFRFCATACCKPYTPFFPAARSTLLIDSDADDSISFAIGLENGKLARRLLRESKSLENIATIFRSGMAEALNPLSSLCESICRSYEGEIKNSTEQVSNIHFAGIDTSLNPSLDENGSVADAIEEIDVVEKFGSRGSVATAAEITKSLKSLPGIRNVGYSGLMLPVCEDRRLAELANEDGIDTTRLLGISSVCGVGLDTIPIPGDSTVDQIMSLILDVSSLAYRYEKSLSCRLLLCPGLNVGDTTNLNSPYMCECKIFRL